MINVISFNSKMSSNCPLPDLQQSSAGYHQKRMMIRRNNNNHLSEKEYKVKEEFRQFLRQKYKLNGWEIDNGKISKIKIKAAL
jgi:hypothetical protein